MEKFHDPNWRVRRESILALASGNPTALTKALIEILSRDHQDLEAVSAALQMLQSLGSPAVTELAELLKAPDADTRLYTALALGELRSPAALPALLEALEDPDPNVRFNVVEALGKLRAAEAVQPLTAILTQEDVALTFAAIHSLGEIGDPAAQAALLPLLQHEFYAPEAVAALGKTGDLEAIEPILNWLESPEGEAPAAVIALTAIARRSLPRETAGDDGDSPAAAGDGGRAHAAGSLPRAALVKLAGSLGSQGRERIRALLDAIEVDRDGANPAGVSDERAAYLPDLAELFGWLLAWETPNPLFSTDFLLNGLRQLLFVPNACQAAAIALANGGPAGIQMLHTCLTDPDPAVRRTAAQALAEAAEPGLLPIDVVTGSFRSALESDDVELACLAAKALGRSGSPDAVPLLEQALGHASTQVREAALAAMQALGLPDLPERLAALVSSPDPRVRQAALRGLAQAGPAVLDRYAANILTALADSSVQVRQAAIEALPQLHDPQVKAALDEASQDPDPTLRMAASRALGEVDPTWAVPRLRRLLVDTHPWTRLYACRSLARHARPETIPDLAQRIHDPMPPVRLAAMEALEHLGGLEARAAILSASTDSEPEVRQAALQAIQRLEAADSSQ